MQFKVQWIDRGRNAQCAPDPLFPSGVDIDYVGPTNVPGCRTELPYPAKRCGYYKVECTKCGTAAIATTAGRADDPRSIRLPCKKKPS